MRPGDEICSVRNVKETLQQRETVQDGKLQVQKGVVSAGFVKYTGTEVLSVSFSFTLLNIYYIPDTLQLFYT